MYSIDSLYAWRTSSKFLYKTGGIVFQKSCSNGIVLEKGLKFVLQKDIAYLMTLTLYISYKAVKNPTRNPIRVGLFHSINKILANYTNLESTTGMAVTPINELLYTTEIISGNPWSFVFECEKTQTYLFAFSAVFTNLEVTGSLSGGENGQTSVSIISLGKYN
jgi:hypothetical protein